MSRTFIGAMVFVMVCLVGGCNKHGGVADHPASKNVIILTQDNFKAEVLSSSQPVLVDFWAAWCGPCRMIAPTVAEVADEFVGKAKVGKVDVDQETALAQEYKISAIPALLIFRDGKVVDQIVGACSKSDLKAALDKQVQTRGTSAPAKS